MKEGKEEREKMRGREGGRKIMKRLIVVAIMALVMSLLS